MLRLRRAMSRPVDVSRYGSPGRPVRSREYPHSLLHAGRIPGRASSLPPGVRGGLGTTPWRWKIPQFDAQGVAQNLRTEVIERVQG